MLKIIKRDGRKVDFSDDKMKSAIWRAMERTEKGIDSQLTTKIVDLFKSKHSGEVEVDQIQDFIEKELMKSSRKDAASEFIKKRHERDVARNAKTKNIFMGIIQAENNEITRENANMNADTPAGMMMKFASETTKPFVDNYLISDEAKDAVRNNYIHIHDKDYYPTKSLTCLSGDTKIKIKDKRGVISQVTINFFDDFFKEKPSQEPELVTLYEPYFILGRNGWTNLNSISRRTVSAKDNYYCLLTDKGSLKVTGTHRIPVITSNGDEVLKQVDNIKVGDKLLSIDSFNTNNDHYLDLSAAFSDDSDDIIVTNINKLRKWLNYKYDFVLDESSYLSIKYYRSLEKKYSIPGDVKVDLCLSNGSRVIPMILPVTPEVADLFGALTWGYFDETVGNNLFLFEDERSINRFKEALAKTKIFGDDYRQERIRFSNKVAYYCTFDFIPVINYFSSLIKDSISGFIKRSDTIKKHFILSQVDNNFKTAYLDKSVAFEMINLLTEVGIEKVFIEIEKNKARLGINQQESKFLLEDILKKEFSVDYSVDPFESTTYTTTEIFNKSLLTKENDVVYDLETSEHWFVANDFVVHNCLQHPLDKILEKGFKAGHGEARPAKRIETASILACISMESIQNEMHKQ